MRKHHHKYFVNQRYKKKKERLYEMTKNWYPQPVYYKNVDVVWNAPYSLKDVKIVKNEHSYLKRAYKGHGYTDLKKTGNRHLRRNNKLESYKGCQYRKTFDLWWKYI